MNFDKFNAAFDEQFKDAPLLSGAKVADKPLTPVSETSTKPDNTALASAHAITITASNAHRLLANPESASLPQGARSYVEEMVDSLLGKERADFDTKATAWGREHEAEAIAAVQKHIPSQIVHIGEEQKRFYYGDFVSALPDGVTYEQSDNPNDGGQYVSGVIEVKCLDTTNHAAACKLETSADLRRVEHEKWVQIQVQMLCASCTNGAFVFYDPRYEPEPLHIIYVDIDNFFIAFFLRRVALAREYYNELLAEDRTAAGFSVSSDPVDDIKLLPQVSLDIGLVKTYHADPEGLVNIIAKQAGRVAFEMGTSKGRDACKAHANKVIKCISPVLDASKQLAADARKAIKNDLDFRKAVEVGLRQLAADIRKPYTEWEIEEELRKKEEARLAEEAAKAEAAELAAEAIKAEIASCEAEAYMLNKIFDLEKKEADRLADEAKQLADQREAEEKERRRIEELRQAEAFAKELIRCEDEAYALDELYMLKKEKADREAEIANQLRQAKEAEQREILQRQADEAARLMVEAEQREKEAKHQRELEEQAEKAERERLQAVENERLRIERETKAKADEAERVHLAEAKKAANRKHQAEVNRVIMAKLLELGLNEAQAEMVIGKAAKREIGALVINY